MHSEMDETFDPEDREFPRYKSHKEVWAIKIAAIAFAENGSAKIAPADEGYVSFSTCPGFRDRFHGDESDPGYYVCYKDGYESWSPTKAFEEGYTRL